MSRTYRRRHDKAPFWVVHDYEWHYGFRNSVCVQVPYTGKDLKREIAKWHSDSGWHGDFGNCPGWWIHDFHEVPMRAKTRNILKKVKRLVDYEDVEEFPIARKPHIYYW